MFRLVADSSCDRPEIAGAAIHCAPMTISTQERSFSDDETLDTEQMLQYLAGWHGRSFTACPSIDAWLTCFGEADEILVVTITSGLSGSYNSACAARDLYLQTHPDAKVAVVDSLSTGPEMRLLLEKAVQLHREGVPFPELTEAVEQYKRRPGCSSPCSRYIIWRRTGGSARSQPWRWVPWVSASLPPPARRA